MFLLETPAPSTSCVAPTPNTKYDPIDNIAGEGRTVATAQQCADRCTAVSGCAYWSQWDDGGGVGGCHLSAASSTQVSATGVTSGVKCQGTPAGATPAPTPSPTPAPTPAPTTATGTTCRLKN